ncbi:MAG TPA: hypothetical protein VFH61_13865 [Thermoleophilia bacterium]|nr:hypothetical protein [Thermoleophilia bacterium]
MNSPFSLTQPMVVRCPPACCGGTPEGVDDLLDAADEAVEAAEEAAEEAADWAARLTTNDALIAERQRFEDAQRVPASTPPRHPRDARGWNRNFIL